MNSARVCRWLVRVASWIVPTRSRPEWRRKWESTLADWWILVERGELSPASAREWRVLVRRLFRHAFETRITREQLRAARRSPALPLAVGIFALAALALSSHGFRGTRALFEPLPVTDPNRLVAIRYSGSAGQPSGVPPRLIPLWRGSSLLSGLAAYSHRFRSPRARATTNFFALLGTRPAAGRLFLPGETDTAVVSAEVWRDAFGTNPPAVGSQIRLDGTGYRVIGVLPGSFWAVSRRIAVWTPLVLEPRPDPELPFLIGAVGRLKPGATPEGLRGELFGVAQRARIRLPRRPEVAAFTAISGRQLPNYLMGIAFAMFIGAVVIVRQQLLAIRPGWRYWSFLAAKTLLALSLSSLIWIESLAALQLRLPRGGLGALFTGLLLTACFLFSSALALWWAFADQRRRCPECLRPLIMPVTIGFWSSIFEPVTTEFLCEAGHGSLCLPETETGEPSHWTTFNPSWRELFQK
ncbi:MAG TPA: ABC transporter permease [Bryobacteraceae bacterium]|nr:ABC transporter permease [Bryobacteraceae bacterium]